MSEDLHKPVSADQLRRRRIWSIVVFGMVCLLIGFAIRSRLTTMASLMKVDPRPGPRPKLNAPFIKTKDEVVDQMITLAGITERDLVYDLGCGDGKIVIGACVQRGCRGVGFDIEPLRIAEAKENAQRQQVDQLVTFQQADVFSVDLREADVIVLYLLPWMVRDLLPQFERCRPGTRIVSEDWMLEGFEADKTIEVTVENSNQHRLFLYVTPLKRQSK